MDRPTNPDAQRDSPDKRYSWANVDDPLLLEYHDREWGVPVHSDPKHFEALILSGAQAGLNWSLVLKKREGYRRAFDGFDAQSRFRERLFHLDDLERCREKFIARLRVLQEREIERVSGSNSLVAEGRFREDLPSRLNVVPIAVPLFAKRVADIPCSWRASSTASEKGPEKN